MTNEQPDIYETIQLPNHPLHVFLLVWLGQLVSLLGSGLTSFALGVWVYQRTGSATQFALISLFTTLPGIVLLPLAGVLVDRWNRRSAMLLSNLGSGLSMLVIALLLLSDRLDVWHIYIAVAVSSTFNAFHWPAYSAATTLLVPPQHLGRASGMVQLGEAAAQILAPVLAGILIAAIQLQGVILVDFVSFLFALITLLMVRIPNPKTTSGGIAAQGSVWREASYGWNYISTRPGLFGLLLFFAATNFAIGMVQVLLTPLVLSFTTANVLGMVLSVAGSGMLLGSVVMSVWGGPKRRVYAILCFTFLQGVLLFLAGLEPNAILIAAAAFAFLFSVPIIVGCSQAIWQSKVEPDLQGRVFAVRRLIGWSSLPLAYLVAGPLADRILEPLLSSQGLLAPSIGQIIGVGPGRGISLLFILLGLSLIVVVIRGYHYLPLRFVEKELPDALQNNVLDDVITDPASIAKHV